MFVTRSSKSESSEKTMTERQNQRGNPSRRFFSADEALALLNEEFSEPYCAGSDDELSADELDDL